MRGKYVMIDGAFPLLFPTAMSHDSIKEKKITSAGFFRIYATGDKLEVAVHGKSVSLGLASDHEDAKVIMAFMQMRSIS